MNITEGSRVICGQRKITGVVGLLDGVGAYILIDPSWEGFGWTWCSSDRGMEAPHLDGKLCYWYPLELIKLAVSPKGNQY